MELSTVPLRVLINYIFIWSRTNDTRLYENMDDIFSAFASRQGLDEDRETTEQLINAAPNILAVFEAAINKSDYYDTYRFQWALNGSGNRNHSYAYQFNTGHPYVSLKPLIQMRLYELAGLGLNAWNKSADHEKHERFRSNVQRLIDQVSGSVEGQYIWYYRPMSLLITDYRNVQQIIHIGNRTEEVYPKILQYILDNNIVPDQHYCGKEKLEMQPFGGGNHPIIITKSYDYCGLGFDLVYLQAKQLVEIYRTLNRNTMHPRTKAEWAYIISLSRNNSTDKFYIYIQSE